MLLNSLEIASVDLSSLWKLWPALIVVAGLSILSLRGWLAWLVYGLAAIGIIALTWMVLTGMIGDNRTNTVSDSIGIERENDDIKKLDLSVDGGAGTFTFDSHGGSELVKSEVKGRSALLEHETKSDNDKQSVRISTRMENGFYIGNEPSDTMVWLNQKTPTRLSIDSGASSIRGDLSMVKLESLDIDTGASSVDLKVGSLTTETKINIDTGVSSVTLRVPENSGVKLLIDSGLSSKNIPDNYTKVDDKTYQSPDYDSKKHKIIIDLDMGVSKFNLEQY